MAIADIDLNPLLLTLNKLSDGRVLQAAEFTREEDFTRVRIPVKVVNTGDKTDQALRRFAADWLRTHTKECSVDTKFEKLPPGVSYYQEGKEEHVVAVLILSWWPRPPMSDFELLRQMQQAKRGPQAE